jgi:hypothetical protein
MANADPSPDTRFRPGRSGNPSGRPRSRPLTDRLREILDDPAEVDKVVRAWLDAAGTGDSGAVRTLLERLEGKLSDRVEHEGEVTIRVEYADGGTDADDHPAEAPPIAG